VCVEEISLERQNVWYAMSDLFLDTELSETDCDAIVRILAASSYSLEELETILADEVAPVLHGNLLVVAGQWGMFDREKEVVQPILKRLRNLNYGPARGWLPLVKLRRVFYLMNVQRPWRSIKNRICEIRV